MDKRPYAEQTVRRDVELRPSLAPADKLERVEAMLHNERVERAALIEAVVILPEHHLSFVVGGALVANTQTLPLMGDRILPVRRGSAREPR